MSRKLDNANSELAHAVWDCAKAHTAAMNQGGELTPMIDRPEFERVREAARHFAAAEAYVAAAEAYEKIICPKWKREQGQR